MSAYQLVAQCAVLIFHADKKSDKHRVQYRHKGKGLHHRAP